MRPPWRDWIREPIDAVRQLLADYRGPKGPKRTTARIVVHCFLAGFLITYPIIFFLAERGVI